MDDDSMLSISGRRFLVDETTDQLWTLARVPGCIYLPDSLINRKARFELEEDETDSPAKGLSTQTAYLEQKGL